VGCADTCWWTTCEDSVAQVVALLDELGALLCLDTRRIHATGISNGGVFLYELAATNPNPNPNPNPVRANPPS